MLLNDIDAILYLSIQDWGKCGNVGTHPFFRHKYLHFCTYYDSTYLFIADFISYIYSVYN